MLSESKDKLSELEEIKDCYNYACRIKKITDLGVPSWLILITGIRLLSPLAICITQVGLWMCFAIYQN